MAALIAIFPLGYARYSDWSGGLCWGPRYIVPAIPLAILPLGELLIRKGSFKIVILVLAIIGFVVQLGATLVDFQRAAIGVPAFFTDPAYSQIVAQWQDIITGKSLDWLPLRLFTMHGITGAIAYVALPLAMLTWAVVSLRSSFRNMDRSLDAGRLPVRMDRTECEKLRQL